MEPLSHAGAGFLRRDWWMWARNRGARAVWGAGPVAPHVSCCSEVAGAGASLGKGAVGFGKNTAVGTTKGVGKIGKGFGGEIKKLDRKSKEKAQKQ